MGKPKNGEPDEKTVTVPADCAKRYPWLKRMKLSLKSAAENAARRARADQKIEDSADRLAADYLRLTATQEELASKLAAVREGLRGCWAKYGLTKAEGVTISPTIKLELPYGEILATIDAETAARIIRYEPVLDLEALLQLADAGNIPQQLVRGFLRGDFSLEIKRVTTAAA